MSYLRSYQVTQPPNRDRTIERLQRASIENETWSYLETLFFQKYGEGHEEFQEHCRQIREKGWFIAIHIATTFRKKGLTHINCYDCKKQLKDVNVELWFIFPRHTELPSVYGLCIDCSLKKDLIKRPQTIAEAYLHQNYRNFSRPQTIEDVEEYMQQYSLDQKDQEITSIENEIEKRQKIIKSLKERVDKLLNEQQLAEDITVTLNALIDREKMERERCEIVKQKLEIKKLTDPLKETKDSIDEMKESMKATIFKFISDFGKIEKKYNELLETSEEIKTNLSKMQCSVCLQPAEKIFALMPCAHVYCINCVSKCTNCPKCRKRIQSTMQVYLD